MLSISELAMKLSRGTESRLRRYWRELLVLAVALGYFIALTAPDMSWVNVDADGPIYMNAAKYLVLSHPTGSPLYNMFNHLVIQIPIGSEYWRLCMVSAISAGFTAMLLFVLAQRYTASKLKALIAPLVFCASGVVVSQATILDTYALMTLLAVLSYYFHVKGMHRAKYAVLGIGVAIHHLIAIPLAVLFLADMVQRRRQGLRVFRPAMFIWMLGFLAYLYIPLANREPYLWIQGDSLYAYRMYFFSQTGLAGGLSVTTADAVQRLQDFIAITGISFGLSGVLIWPAVWQSFKRRDTEAIILTFLFIFPLVHYLTNMAPQVYTYTISAFAFGGLLAVKGSEYFNLKRIKIALPVLVAITSVVLIGYNVHAYDIGRTLDKDLTMKQYYEQLHEIPDGTAIWMPKGSWWRSTIYLHNNDHDRELETLPYFLETGPYNLEVAQERHADNNLWIQEYTDDAEWVSIIRPVTDEDWEVITDTAAHMKGWELEYEWTQGQVVTGWAHPTDLITGKLEMSRWWVATRSSHTAVFVILAFFWCAMSQSVADWLFAKRAKSKRQLQMIRWIVFIVMLSLLLIMFSLSGMERWGMVTMSLMGNII